MKKLSLLAVAVLLMAACGGGNNAPAPKANTTAPANNASAEAPKETPETVAIVYEMGIEGMTWGTGWVKSAETALARLDGVEKVKVSFMDKKATITMKPGKKVTEEQARAAIQKANDEEGNAFELVSFKQVN